MPDLDSDEALAIAIQRATIIKETINTQGFQLLMNTLEEEAETALLALKNAPPTDFKAIQKLQNVCWRYDELVIRLQCFLEDGDTADKELNYNGEIE